MTQLTSYLPVITALIGVAVIFAVIYKSKEHTLAKAMIIGVIFFLLYVFVWLMTDTSPSIIM